MAINHINELNKKYNEQIVNIGDIFDLYTQMKTQYKLGNHVAFVEPITETQDVQPYIIQDYKTRKRRITITELVTEKDLSYIQIVDGKLLINKKWEHSTLITEKPQTDLRESFGSLYDHIDGNNNTNIPRGVCDVLHEILDEGTNVKKNIQTISNIKNKTQDKNDFIKAMIKELENLKQQQARLITSTNHSLAEQSSINENNDNKMINNNFSTIETKDLEPKDAKQKSSKNKKIQRNHKKNIQPPFSKLFFGSREDKNKQNASQIQINNTKDNNTYKVILSSGADMNTVKTLLKDVIKETKNLEGNAKEDKYLRRENDESFESIEGDFKYEKKGENTHIFTFPNKDTAANFVAKLRLKSQITKDTHETLCKKLGVNAKENLEKYKSKEITGEQTNIQLTTMNATQPTPNQQKNRKHSNTRNRKGPYAETRQKKVQGNRNNDNDAKQRVHKRMKMKNTNIKNSAYPDSTDNTNQESNNIDSEFKP